MANKESNPGLVETERALKKADFYTNETSVPEDPEYYDYLHDRIMAAVDKAEIKPPPPIYKNKDLLKRHWRQGIMFTFVFVLTITAFNSFKGATQSLITNNHAIQSAHNEDQMLDLIKGSPEMMAQTILSYKSEEEVFEDIVSP